MKQSRNNKATFWALVDGAKDSNRHQGEKIHLLQCLRQRGLALEDLCVQRSYGNLPMYHIYPFTESLQ